MGFKVFKKSGTINFVAFLCMAITTIAVAQEAVVSQPSVTPEPEETLPPPVEATPNIIKIYKHFRFKDGELFVPGPTPTPIINVKELSSKLIDQAKEAVSRDTPPLNEVFSEGFAPPEMHKCLENSTDNVDAPDKFPEGLEGENSPAYDLLFIEGSEIPEDYMTIFGVTTLIVPFIRETPNVGWDLIESMGVPCLPYRIRFQGSKIYADSGLNALKNYAKSPKGEFHPYIKAKYNLK